MTILVTGAAGNVGSAEAWLRDSGLSWTFVRAAFFHQNLSTTHVSDIRDRNEIMVPAGHGATALLHPNQHINRAWTITGPRALTYTEIAQILTAELDRPIHYRHPGLLRYLCHAHRQLQMPWPMAAVTTATYTTARLGLAAGLTHDVETVLHRAPIDFTDYAHRARDAWNPTNATSPSPNTSGKDPS